MSRRKNPEGRMSLAGHLRELRNRLIWSAGFVLLGTISGWFLFDPVFKFLQQPLIDVSQRRGVQAVVNFGTVVSAFDLRIQVSIFLGIILTSPIWLYNLWAFITPGLQNKERKYTLGFLLSAIPLFLSGTALAWFSLPNFVTVLIGFTPEGSTNVINASEYVLFAIRILLLFGISFVLPVVLVLLNMAGLASGKAILKSWRLAIFLIAVISAVATPTADPISMFLLMAPLAVLYFVAVGVAFINDKIRLRRNPELALTEQDFE